MVVLFAFLHHLAAFMLVAMLAVELVLLRQELTLASARRLMIIDGIYGASAGLLLLVGLARVFFFEKGAAYYFTNHAFLTKFGLFILIGVISAIPTIEFLKWRRSLKLGQLPAVSAQQVARMRSIIHWELVAVVLILLAAPIMARGGWI